MVRVVVAGGSGGLGQHIVDAILATKKHDVVVLSRSPKPALSRRGATVIPVSYTDTNSLENALKGADAVISTMVDYNPTRWVASQLALLNAAKKAGVRRFAPSEWTGRNVPNDPINLYACRYDMEKAVRKSGLEFTFFENGAFMNYLGCGTPGVGYIDPWKLIVDVENCSATIPGDGNNPIVMTRTEDIGAFVAASLDLPKWPEVSRMRGDRMTYNEIVAVAEKVRGRKFSLTYVPIKELESRLATNKRNGVTNFGLELITEIGRTDRFGFADANLNDLCPQVKPMTIEQFLRKWWGKV